MVCPVCGAHISDRCLVCPACRSDVESTRMLPKTLGNYCSVCASALDPHAQICPACGAPVAQSFDAAQTPAKKTNARISGARARDAVSMSPSAPTPAPATSTSQAHYEQSAHVKNSRESVAAAAPMPVPAPARARTQAFASRGDALSSDSSLSADETHSIPRITSAIPSFPQENGYDAKQPNGPRLRMLFFALAFALIFISSIVLAITHPWNPDFFDIKAKVGTDMSNAGFPGKRSELHAQDKKSETARTQSADDETYDQLKSAYDELGELFQKIDDNEELLRKTYATASKDDLKKGASELSDLAITLSNKVQAISSVNVESGTYAQDKSHIASLASWLRNHVDALRAAWKNAIKYQGKSVAQDKIAKNIGKSDQKTINSTYKSLFTQNYDRYKPVYKEPAK